MLPDDDKRYAIETCRSSESVLKKWFKNKWHTISAFVGCVIIIEWSRMFHADGRADGHDEDNSHFSQFCERA